MGMTHDTSLDARTLARIQAASGLVFGLFLAAHLLNTFTAPFGPDAYDAVQRPLRLLYRNPVFEVVAVFASVAVHVAAGVLRARRREGPAPRGARERAHRYAGWFLAVFFVGHAGATRLPSLLEGVDVGFDGLGYTLTRYGLWFYPYYALLGTAGAVHLLFGVPRALSVLGVRAPAWARRGRALPAASGLAAVLVLVSLLAFGGVWFETSDPAEGRFAAYVRAAVAGTPLELGE